MRIEDLDPPRVVRGSAARIVDDLRWLGMDWDEGPFYQSKRLPLYTKTAEKILASAKKPLVEEE